MNMCCTQPFVCSRQFLGNARPQSHKRPDDHYKNVTGVIVIVRVIIDHNHVVTSSKSPSSHVIDIDAIAIRTNTDATTGCKYTTSSTPHSHTLQSSRYCTAHTIDTHVSTPDRCADQPSISPHIHRTRTGSPYNHCINP